MNDSVRTMNTDLSSNPTVAELMAALQKMPQDAPVRVIGSWQKGATPRVVSAGPRAGGRYPLGHIIISAV